MVVGIQCHRTRLLDNNGAGHVASADTKMMDYGRAITHNAVPGQRSPRVQILESM